MEGAPLHAGGRPEDSPRLLEPAGAVRRDHIKWCHARHEYRPDLRVFTSGQVPAYDVIFRAGYECHHVAANPCPVDEDNVVALVAGKKGGSYPRTVR